MTVQLGPTRWLTATECHECFIDVESSEHSDDWKFVSVSLMSTHTGAWSQGFGVRIRNAWRCLRGRGSWWFEFATAEPLDDHIAALQAARTTAFGPPPQP